MTTINNLSTIDSVSSGDQVPVYDESAGTARKMSVSQLLAFFSANFASPEFEVQTAAPTTTGFTVTLTASADSIWALISPTGTMTSGTILLPPVADCFDGQEILVTSTALIGDPASSGLLTVNGNGATVSAGPDSIAAGGSFVLRYRALDTTWYVVAKSTGATVEAVNISASASISAPLAEITEVSAGSVSADSVSIFPVAVADLGSAANVGRRKFVTDANATTFASIVADGGANVVPVYADGTDWRIG